MQGKIKDVYNENMTDELRKISELIEHYNYISMDTEFPGIVFNSSNMTCLQGNNKNFSNQNQKNILLKQNFQSEISKIYQCIKQNVDNLKLIQLGITLSDCEGNYPEECSTWQFNFKFDLNSDLYFNDSINLLEQSGIDFNRFYQEGIEPDYFGENFISSGIVLNDNINWITFHGSYDFAYLLKTISNQSLPDEEQGFLDYLSLYFPNYYDVRHLIRNISWLKGSLSKITNDLDITRVGQSHQAGSDSLVTNKVFFKLCKNLSDKIDFKYDKNQLFGFNVLEDYESLTKDYSSTENIVGLNRQRQSKIPSFNQQFNNPSNLPHQNSIYNNPPQFYLNPQIYSVNSIQIYKNDPYYMQNSFSYPPHI
jgi:CCR4-NOT transcription complex subunit 7/8